MRSFDRYPGEGLVFDVTYAEDVSTWAVVAALVNPTPTQSVVVETTASPNTRRVSVSGAITAGLAGRGGTIKVTATNPAATAYPVVEEIQVRVSIF